MLRRSNRYSVTLAKVASLSLATFAQLALAEPQVRWVSDPTNPAKAVVELTGVDEKTLQAFDPSRLKEILLVRVDQSSEKNQPPMLGTYRIEGGTVRFEPRFPLDAGMNYQAVFTPADAAQKPIAASYRPAQLPAAQATVVSQIYPSGSVVPENLLKFYLYFSAPMSGGRIYDHIHLRDSSEKDVELPFLEIDEELWNHEMTRLTLFIDPGRIKRGVKPLEDIGPALETGKKFTLVIDRAWKDAAGNLLREGFEKKFEVGPPDREPPDPKKWNVQSPGKGGAAPLTVQFNEPMDHALAMRMIQVTNETGNALAGTSRLDENETKWIFIPAQAWKTGRHRIEIPTTIEDLAGNNIGKPFDVDLAEGGERRVDSHPVQLPFEVK